MKGDVISKKEFRSPSFREDIFDKDNLEFEIKKYDEIGIQQTFTDSDIFDHSYKIEHQDLDQKDLSLADIEHFDDIEHEEFVDAVRPISQEMAKRVFQQQQSVNFMRHISQEETHTLLSDKEYLGEHTPIGAIVQEEIEDWSESIESIEDSGIGDYISVKVERESQEIASDLRSTRERAIRLENRVESNEQRIENTQDTLMYLSEEIDDRFERLYRELTRSFVGPLSLLLAIVSTGVFAGFALQQSFISIPLALLALLFWMTTWHAHRNND